MKKISPLNLIALLLTSCISTETIPGAVPASIPTLTLNPSATATATETPLPTFTPTATLSPDLNRYECAENVSQTDCDFVKEGVRLARYFFANNLGSDILRGVKFTIINDPNDIKFGEGGSAGTFRTPGDGEPFVWINVGHPLWVEYAAPEYQHYNTGLVIHEFTHAWQWQHGCLSDLLNIPASPTSFLIQGYAGYAGYVASGADLGDFQYSDDRALSFWQASEWDETRWFDNSDVNFIVVRHLVEDHGIEAYAQYCDEVGKGAQPNDAFQSAYGISIAEFRENIQDQILGTLKDCTVATCGAGIDNDSDRFKLGHLLDPAQKTPNLIVHFVDQDNDPVILTHVSMLKQNVGTTGEYAQPFIVPGIFSQAMFPGRYSFFFCEPGFPVNQNDALCQYHETDWLDVFSDKVTELTFQIPMPIVDQSLSNPNLEVIFFDKDGNPVPNLALQVCSYENPVKVCSNPFEPDRKTDSAGVYHDYLRSGRYVIRIPTSPDLLRRYEFFPFYEMKDIKVNDNQAITIEYHFPIPNLVVKFVDANGTPAPMHEFVLCEMSNGIGDCNSPIYNQGRWGITNKKGVFEVFVEPGEYYILTGKIDRSGYPWDYTIENIVVLSETEVTTVEFQLYQ